REAPAPARDRRAAEAGRDPLAALAGNNLPPGPRAPAAVVKVADVNALAGASAGRLAQAIGAGEASAREVVEAHLRRIDAVNGAVNALVQVDGERALAAADAADAALARREPAGPLHGVPFTVKDNISADGIVMAIGDPARAKTIAGADATVVARMRAAGAILLGKSNCPEYGGGIETDNAVYGRTNNPLDLSRTPGGSS